MNTTLVGVKPSEHSSSSWETQSNVVTHDDVIEAYLKGKKRGRSEQQIAALNLFKENYERAKSISESLYDQVFELGYRIRSLHLRADSIISFNALLIINKEDFVNESFLKSFSIARVLKNQIDTDTFRINFTFTPDSDTLDINCLSNDGFFAKYAEA